MKKIVPIIILLIFNQLLFPSVRIATYNVKASEGLGDYGAEVLEEMGNEILNGISRPVDILILQECDDTNFNTEKAIRNILNAIYGQGIYSYSTLSTSGYMMRVGLVYNTQTVQLMANVSFKDSAAPRSTGRYQFRIKGYDPSSDIYIYNDHYKAYSGDSDLCERAIEALRVRWDKNHGGDALPEGSHIIYAGDYNLLSPYDDANLNLYGLGQYDVTASGGRDNAWYYLVNLPYLPGSAGTTYISTGNGRAIDPAGFSYLTNWNTSTYKNLHSYSSVAPTTRLDFQLVSGEVYDGEGVSLIAPGVGNCHAAENSYHVFPNDGTHTYGGRLVDTVNSKYDRILQYYAAVFSDHLSVVADYQRPAILEVQVNMPTSPVSIGSPAIATITVTNNAQTSSPVGADELDYEIEVLSGGTLISSPSGVDLPLGGGNVHQVLLDTGVVGSTSLVVQVTSNSQSVANGIYSESFDYDVSLNCDLLEFVSAWLSQPGDANWDPDCNVSDIPDNCIDLQDFAVISQYWIF